MDSSQGPEMKRSIISETEDEPQPWTIDTLAGSSLQKQRFNIPARYIEPSLSNISMSNSIKVSLTKTKYQHLRHKPKVNPIEIGLEETMQLNEEGRVIRQK